MGYTSLLLLGLLLGLGLLLFGVFAKPRTAGKTIAIVIGAIVAGLSALLLLLLIFVFIPNM